MVLASSDSISLFAFFGAEIMAYGFFNPNPSGKRVGDCVIRGISSI